MITGASAGLGAEFARQLAPYATSLILVARRGDRLEELKSELHALFPELQVFPYVADLTDENQRAGLARWLDQQGIRVDFLINNAGLGDKGDFETAEWERVRAMIDTNMTALTHLSHLLLPAMSGAGRAAILNVSSVAGFFPLPNMAVYGATKAYVTSLSEALAIELKPRGITVTALCPGPVPTEFFDVAMRNPDERPHFETLPAYAATAADVVYDGLRAVAAGRPRVIPNLLLCASVTIALAVPFFIVRKIIAAMRGSL